MADSNKTVLSILAILTGKLEQEQDFTVVVEHYPNGDVILEIHDGNVVGQGDIIQIAKIN